MKIVAIIALALLVGYGILYVSQQRKSVTAPTTTTVVTSPAEADPTQIKIEQNLSAGGNSYTDPNNIFTLLYPNDWRMDELNGQYIRFYKIGATQQGQTEMYDGVNFTIEPVNLQGTGLETWVDTKIQSSTSDGTLQITSPKKAMTINGHPAFTYTARGLGEATYIVVQKDASSQNALSISYLVSDPQNVGYQSEVDAILSTIDLL